MSLLKNQQSVSFRLKHNSLVKQFDLTPGGSPSHVAWDGKDEQGRVLPNGIYFLRVDTPDSNDILCQKVLRIR